MEAGGAEEAGWWSGACEEDAAVPGGLEAELLLSRGFLPPPPRPPSFLDHRPPSSDGLTTCDLCAWATHQTSSLDTISFMSWSVTLVIVSIISAAIGATVMVSLRRCFKKLNDNPVPRGLSGRGEAADKVSRSGVAEGSQASGLCCWISRRTVTRQPLRADVSAAANHYTLEETYAGGGEALYAELDKPVYQNTGYVLEPDTGSPPSSAYYSDLSDRTYETVGNTWEMHRYRPHPHHHHHHHHQTSDYV